jgi:Tfp pilus assembly protein PilV
VRQRGFSIVEAVIAAGILIGALAALVQLAVMSRRVTRGASMQSSAALFAVDKLEELRGSAWPAQSPADALDRDIDGFADRVAGVTRRWSVRPLPSVPAEALVLQVRVLARPGVDMRFVTVRARLAE